MSSKNAMKIEMKYEMCLSEGLAHSRNITNVNCQKHYQLWGLLWSLYITLEWGWQIPRLGKYRFPLSSGEMISGRQVGGLRSSCGVSEAPWGIACLQGHPGVAQVPSCKRHCKTRRALELLPLLFSIWMSFLQHNQDSRASPLNLYTTLYRKPRKWP